jgi:hypothetical protein
MDRHDFQFCRTAVVALGLGCVTLVIAPQWALAHGTPAKVSISQGKLTVTGNVAAPVGYAKQVLAETDPDSLLVSISGNRLFTDFPGFDLHGITSGAELRLEPLSVTYFASQGPADRLLWYWSPAEEGVATLPDDNALTLLSARGFGEVTLSQFGGPPSPLLFMEPLVSDNGNHRHPLYYIVDNSPLAPMGAYGFFARLSSPTYLPSDPFLLVLNHGLSAATFVEAALDINRKAVGIVGDYNHDGAVDATDYVVWRNHRGATQLAPYDLGDGDGDGDVDELDYLVWKSQYRKTRYREMGPQLESAQTAGIPEPHSCTLLGWACLAIIRWFTRVSATQTTHFRPVISSI